MKHKILPRNGARARAQEISTRMLRKPSAPVGPDAATVALVRETFPMHEMWNRPLPPAAALRSLTYVGGRDFGFARDMAMHPLVASALEKCQ